MIFLSIFALGLQQYSKYWPCALLITF